MFGDCLRNNLGDFIFLIKLNNFEEFLQEVDLVA